MQPIHFNCISISEKVIVKAITYCCTLLLLIMSLQVQGQDAPVSKIGIRAGANLNSWTNDYPYLEFGGQRLYPDAWEATSGFHLGVYFNVRLSELLAIEPGIMYTQKGTGTSLDLAGGSFGKGTIISNYVDIPLLMRLYVADGFNLFLGPQLSYHINSSYSLSIDHEILLEDEDFSNEMSELDGGLILGMGYAFDNGININLSGEFGLLSVDRLQELKTYNRTIRFSLGYMF